MKNGFAMVPDSGIVAGLFVLGFELWHVDCQCDLFQVL